MSEVNYKVDFAKFENWFDVCEGKRIMYKQLINN